MKGSMSLTQYATEGQRLTAGKQMLTQTKYLQVPTCTSWMPHAHLKELMCPGAFFEWPAAKTRVEHPAGKRKLQCDNVGH